MTDLKTFQAFAYAELEKLRPAEGTPALSECRTAWAVTCRTHGQQFLTEDEYNRQLCRPDSLWNCPCCGASAEFDDANYEAFLEEVSPTDRGEADGEG